VRPRRRKAFEQPDGKRDRFQVDQRRGRGWDGLQRRRQARVRVQQGSVLRHSDSEDVQNHDAPVQTYDGRAALQYSRPGRKVEDAQRLHSDSAVFRRRQDSWHVQHQQRAPSSCSATVAVCGGGSAARLQAHSGGGATSQR